jgi:hypothetical protein
MTYTAPVASYSATLDGTYTALTGIQSISVNRGRQRFQDNFLPTSCVIELIPANSYALPLTVGQFIDVRDANTSTSPCYFAGRITDVSRRFDMPFNAVSGAAPGDRITITATGATGVLASNSVTDFPALSNICWFDVFFTSDRLGINVGGVDFNGTETPDISFTGGALDLINALLRTEQFFIDDLDNRRLAYRINNFHDFLATQYPPGQGNRNFVFSDANTLGAFKFAALEYLSSVQNTFTEVEVVAPGIATQVASTGVAPFNTLVYNTYNASTLAASNLAQLVIATQNLVSVTPFSVSTNTLLSPTCTTLSVLSNETIFDGVSDNGMNLGSAVTVEFRGTTVQAQIQGINTAFYPDQARVQLYLSPSLGAQFILDNATFGVLDQNKLGF